MPTPEELVRVELARLAPLVVPAIKHLRRVTGKRFMTDINPFLEKRWSERCWDCWETVWRVDVMKLYGRPWWEVEQAQISSHKMCDSWSGAVHPDAPLIKRYGTTFADSGTSGRMAPGRGDARRHR